MGLACKNHPIRQGTVQGRSHRWYRAALRVGPYLYLREQRGVAEECGVKMKHTYPREYSETKVWRPLPALPSIVRRCGRLAGACGSVLWDSLLVDSRNSLLPCDV